MNLIPQYELIAYQTKDMAVNQSIQDKVKQGWKIHSWEIQHSHPADGGDRFWILFEKLPDSWLSQV